MDEAELAAVPYVLIGTQREIIAKLGDIERRWGITRFAVRRPALDVISAVIAAY